MMHLHDHLRATNISVYGVFAMGARIRKPKAIGPVLVREHDSNTYGTEYVIPKHAVNDLEFFFFVEPPVCERSQPFKGDVAIMNQFGNEHWLRSIEFAYSGK